MNKVLVYVHIIMTPWPYPFQMEQTNKSNLEIRMHPWIFLKFKNQATCSLLQIDKLHMSDIADISNEFLGIYVQIPSDSVARRWSKICAVMVGMLLLVSSWISLTCSSVISSRKFCISSIFTWCFTNTALPHLEMSTSYKKKIYVTYMYIHLWFMITVTSVCMCVCECIYIYCTCMNFTYL